VSRPVADDRATATPPCPTCGSAGIPVVYGLPAASAREAAADGVLLQRGCVLPLDPPQWGCANGHDWHGDEQTWERVYHDAIRGRPRCPSCGGRTWMRVHPGGFGYPGGAEALAKLIETDFAVVVSDPDPDGRQVTLVCREGHTSAGSR
jgi:hypothetical protein